jgi:probable blue pigment (indigoidine) exporter
MSVPRSRRRYVVALILAAASWGVATAISKRAVAEIPPLVLLPIQLSVSVAVLAVVMRLSGTSIRRPGGSPFIGWLGVLNPGVSYALSLAGLVYISASLSVLLWAAEPLMILVLARALLGERVSRRLVVLSAVAVTGLGLVIYEPSSGGRVVGVIFTLAGVACCATYTVLTREHLGAADSTIRVVAVQQVYAFGLAAILVAAFAMIDPASRVGRVSPEAWASAVVSGLLYYAVAFWLYLTGLRGVTASFAAVSFYLIPVFGIAAGVVLLDETFGPAQWVGIAIVLAAVLGIVSRPGDAPEAVQVGGTGSTFGTLAR